LAPRFTVLALALAALPSLASAQGIARYTAPFSGDDLMVTERAVVTPHLRVGGLVAAEYTHALASPSPSLAPIENRVTAHAVVSFGLFDRLQLGVAVPLVITQSGPANLASTSVGDVRVDARVRIAGFPRRGAARLSLATTLTLPSGDATAFTGDGKVGVVPRLLFEVNNARDFIFAVNLGVAVRPGWEHQLLARVGITLPILRRVLVTLEGAFETQLTDPSQSGALVFEALGGVHRVGREGLSLGLAAGPRILDGAGSADVRVVGLVGYAPQPPDAPDAPGDRDVDGVLDPDDRCPDTPAGERPDPRNPGCPIGDRDHDGFRDEIDQCPDEVPGDEPDPRRVGCPREDADGDGVRDRDDQCPVESAGVRPDPDHRGCPLRDGDDDGFLDGDDLCPTEPAGRHPDARRRGCPDPDMDGDEIPNERDACPEERGPRTRDPATNGCPRVYVTPDRVVITQQPRFATDRDVILPASVPLLMEVASVIDAHSELTRIEIQGHTDNQGTDAHNDDLSQRRAASIRAWLVGRGISPERLVARGYGASRPIADNNSTQGRQHNRRVEFVVVERTPDAQVR
jgi:outer membrane protein OmpA-like peptidoglycan-associated protein